MVKGEPVTIGQVSEKTGLSIHTLRYYENLGMFGESVIRREPNNYREYADSVFDVLHIIRCSKEAGFTLKEIAAYLGTGRIDTMTREEKIEVLEKKMREIDKKIEDIRTVRKMLSEKLGRIKADYTDRIDRQFFLPGH